MGWYKVKNNYLKLFKITIKSYFIQVLNESLVGTEGSRSEMETL